MTSVLRPLVFDEKGLLTVREAYDQESRESYTVYTVTNDGLQWLQANQERLVLKTPPKDDEVPF